jgi:hypothetical protein
VSREYHTLYREARKDWAVVPYEEMIRWCQQRSGYVIGDFGCGEAKLAEAVSDQHTVYNFDHVAVNDDVMACDMAHVPLRLRGAGRTPTDSTARRPQARPFLNPGS